MSKAICICIFIFVIQGCLSLPTKKVCPEPERIEPCNCANDKVFGITLRCESFSLATVVEKAVNNSKGYKYDLVIISSAKLEYITHFLFEKVKIKELRLEYLRLDRTFDSPPKAALKDLKKLVLKGILVNSGSPWETLRPLKSLQTLFVEDIRMEKIGKGFSEHVTKDLENFYFKNTQTETIEPGTFEKFKNIRLLSISNSSISNLKRDMFPTPCNVQNLSFEHGKMTNIPDGLFSNMPHLKYVSLSGNRIGKIPEKAFDKNFKVELLMVDDNPIKCDCRFKWLLYKRLTLSGTCASPKLLQGKRLDHVSKRYFNDC